MPEKTHPPPHSLSTTHSLEHGDARRISFLAPGSVELVVTSPPYPMIAMWDDCFSAMSPTIKQALTQGDGQTAFSLMHATLDTVWEEVIRVVKPGGFICINVGDAVRTCGEVFRLYPNHSRIEQFFFTKGLDVLPRIIWRKTTNAPNKFMGSGMLPAGAYVTLEHEYILIFRKSGKRKFMKTDEKLRRRQSAIFWEERNTWYSDLWDLAGAKQKLAGAGRDRSAAFPFELPYRLISMYSVIEDTVLDPFVGTGTTLFAAAALGRNSVGIDSDSSLITNAGNTLTPLVATVAKINEIRIQRHHAFCTEHLQGGKKLLYNNKYYGFPVKTAQETDLLIPRPISLPEQKNQTLKVDYDFRLEAASGAVEGELWQEHDYLV